MFMIDLGVQSHYSLLGISPDATITEIREARDRLGKELTEKKRLTKDNEEKKKIEDRQKKINEAGEVLVRAEEREKYDHENSHLRFFVVQVAAVPMFVDKADRFYALNRIIREFLTTKGTTLTPISDHERDDFSADETTNNLLDNLLR